MQSPALLLFSSNVFPQPVLVQTAIWWSLLLRLTIRKFENSSHIKLRGPGIAIAGGWDWRLIPKTRQIGEMEFAPALGTSVF